MSKDSKRWKGGGLITQLQRAIRDSGKSLNGLAHDSGLRPSQLSRFMRGERGLTIEAVDKLCRALRLRLTAEPEGRRRN